MGDAQYVFGPVLSRRLGRSLGVDVIPFKTCSYDCIYCQLGRTRETTCRQADYVPLDLLLSQIRVKVEQGHPIDYVTIAGSGEPLLYTRLGELIAGIKQFTSIPIAVITNGSLLWEERVQERLLDADVVIPSLDAGRPATFARVNRPHAGVPFEKMAEGLVAFRARFRNQLWLEVFLLEGVSDSDEEIVALRFWLDRIRPDRVQLNTVARPTADGSVRPVTPKRMAELAERLGHGAEVVAHYEMIDEAPTGSTSADQVLGVIQRHPCTIEDIARGLNVPLEEALRYADQLVRDGHVFIDLRDGLSFYRARQVDLDPS